jgi:hypothetical protein
MSSSRRLRRGTAVGVSKRHRLSAREPSVGDVHASAPSTSGEFSAGLLPTRSVRRPSRAPALGRIRRRAAERAQLDRHDCNVAQAIARACRGLVPERSPTSEGSHECSPSKGIAPMGPQGTPDPGAWDAGTRATSVCSCAPARPAELTPTCLLWCDAPASAGRLPRADAAAGPGDGACHGQGDQHYNRLEATYLAGPRGVRLAQAG